MRHQIFKWTGETSFGSEQFSRSKYFFLRDDDIPQYVEDAVADIGIVGENVLMEDASDVEIVERLGFGKCRLVARSAEIV